MNYGKISNNSVIEAIKKVCDCLGYGKNKTAGIFICEILATETQFGDYYDRTLYAGMGIAQFDKRPFNDVKKRTRTHNKLKVQKELGIDIDLVKWEDLRYNVLLSVLFARLKLLLIPDHIPVIIELRSDYWKKYYNSYAGKGTTEDYMLASESLYTRLWDVEELKHYGHNLNFICNLFNYDHFEVK